MHVCTCMYMYVYITVVEGGGINISSGETFSALSCVHTISSISRSEGEGGMKCSTACQSGDFLIAILLTELCVCRHACV